MESKQEDTDGIYYLQAPLDVNVDICTVFIFYSFMKYYVLQLK